MTGTRLRLSAPDVLAALMAVDALTPCVEALVARADPATAGAEAQPRVDARLDHRTELPATAGLVELVLTEPGAPTRCLLPASDLRASRAAALAVVTARALLAPGVVTAAVFGSAQEAQPQLVLIAQFVREVSHIAVFLGPDRGRAIDPRVLDVVARAGIELTLTDDVGQAVLGATLVVTTSADLGRVRYPQLAAGALLVNASGSDLADDLVDRVGKVYTDAPDLLAGRPDRYFVRRHLAAAPARGPEDHPPGLAIGAGDVLRGAHRCRFGPEEIRLVELLSVGEPDLALAVGLYRAAYLLGLVSPAGRDLP